MEEYKPITRARLSEDKTESGDVPMPLAWGYLNAAQSYIQEQGSTITSLTERVKGLEFDKGIVEIALEQRTATLAQADQYIERLEREKRILELEKQLAEMHGDLRTRMLTYDVRKLRNLPNLPLLISEKTYALQIGRLRTKISKAESELSELSKITEG
jgi:uncharacterized protein (UPF0335 family)